MNSILYTLIPALLIAAAAFGLGLFFSNRELAPLRELLAERWELYTNLQGQMVKERLKQVEALRDMRKDVDYAGAQVLIKERENRQLRAQVHSLSAENEALSNRLSRLHNPDATKVVAAVTGGDLDDSRTWSEGPATKNEATERAARGEKLMDEYLKGTKTDEEE